MPHLCYVTCEISSLATPHAIGWIWRFACSADTSLDLTPGPTSAIPIPIARPAWPLPRKPLPCLAAALPGRCTGLPQVQYHANLHVDQRGQPELSMSDNTLTLGTVRLEIAHAGATQWLLSSIESMVEGQVLHSLTAQVRSLMLTLILTHLNPNPHTTSANLTSPSTQARPLLAHRSGRATSCCRKQRDRAAIASACAAAEPRPSVPRRFLLVTEPGLTCPALAPR